MDLEKLSTILKNKKFVVWDFDGTIVYLDIDWDGMKKEIAEVLAQTLENDAPLEIVAKYESQSGVPKVNHKLISFMHYLPHFVPGVEMHHSIFSDNLLATIYRLLPDIGLGHFPFDIIIARESVDRRKPYKDGLIKIQQYYHYDDAKRHLGEYVFVGNSWKDEEAAKAAGIDFYNIGWL